MFTYQTMKYLLVSDMWYLFSALCRWRFEWQHSVFQSKEYHHCLTFLWWKWHLSIWQPSLLSRSETVFYINEKSSLNDLYINLRMISTFSVTLTSCSIFILFNSLIPIMLLDYLLIQVSLGIVVYGQKFVDTRTSHLCAFWASHSRFSLFTFVFMQIWQL